MSTSEFTQPQFTTPTGGNNRGNCTAVATSVGGGVFRLVLNSELYEGQSSRRPHCPGLLG